MQDHHPLTWEKLDHKKLCRYRCCRYPIYKLVPNQLEGEPLHYLLTRKDGVCKELPGDIGEAIRAANAFIAARNSVNTAKEAAEAAHER